MNDVNVHRYDLLREAMMSREPLKPVEAAIATALKGGHRVWVVGSVPSVPTGFSPRQLPPAPLPIAGWSDAPYRINWSVLLAHALRTHARREYRIPIAIGQTVNSYENVLLVVFEGGQGSDLQGRSE